MGAEARAKDTAAAAAVAEIEQRLKAAIPWNRHQLIDAYGKPIMVGGSYAHTPGLPVPMTIVDIKPNVAATDPPDTYTVVLMAQVSVRAMSRVPIRSLLLIQSPPEVETKADTNGQGNEQTSNIQLTDL